MRVRRWNSSGSASSGRSTYTMCTAVSCAAAGAACFSGSAAIAAADVRNRMRIRRGGLLSCRSWELVFFIAVEFEAGLVLYSSRRRAAGWRCRRGQSGSGDRLVRGRGDSVCPSSRHLRVQPPAWPADSSSFSAKYFLFSLLVCLPARFVDQARWFKVFPGKVSFLCVVGSFFF